MLKKAIFAEISLFAAVKSPFYSVPVSAFLFPTPTKLGFCQNAVSRETISKTATGFSYSVCYCIFCPHAGSLFGTPYSSQVFPKQLSDDGETEPELPLFCVFLLSTLFHVKRFAKTAAERADWTDAFCILSAFHVKHSLKTAPRRHAF